MTPSLRTKLEDFREVLRRLEAHAGERYFVLKSIIIGNLYGVDLMEEAVEICKLRLFLKLVAQVERKEDIEPLPDIDFNVRSGNTLVGFASLGEVKEALSGDWIKEQNLPQIEERAKQADVAFGKFRRMQTELDMDANQFNQAKADLQARLEALHWELDGYLAKDYGVKLDNKEAYEQWQKSHRPFHWLVEFYGIMRQGGFDVIIGNPLYLALRDLTLYMPIKYRTKKTGNLYPLILERCDRISSNNGNEGYIVPVSSISTEKYGTLQDLYDPHSIVFCSFDDRPAHLFFRFRQKHPFHLAEI